MIKSNTIRIKTTLFKASLLTNQLIAMGLEKVCSNECSSLIVAIPIKEIIHILQKHDTNIYRRVKQVAERLALFCRKIPKTTTNEHSEKYIACDGLIIKNSNGTMSRVDLINNSKYTNRSLIIEFSPEIRSYITELKELYGPDKAQCLYAFTHNKSFSLYSLLRQEPALKETGEAEVEYTTSELRCLLSLVNPYFKTDETNEDTAAPTPCPTMINAAPQKEILYQEFRDFNLYLKFAQNEINEKSDLLVDYTCSTIKHGRIVKERIIKFKIERKTGKARGMTEEEINRLSQQLMTKDIWERIKNDKEHKQTLKAYLDVFGLDYKAGISELESLYSSEELVKMYFEFKRNML